MKRLLFSCVIALLALSCSPNGNGVNVLLISIDTLRPDHLGCYGYERETSPNLDAFCRESTVFREAIAHAPSTLPSHASIFTSLLPAHHGASFANKTPLPDDVLTLAEILEEQGYRTGSFNGGGQIDPIWGLDQGFDVYESKEEETFRQIVDSAEAWLRRGTEQEPDRPFFLFLHTYEVHHPYTPARDDLGHFIDPPRSDQLGSTVEVQELKRLNRGPRPVDDGVAEFIEAAYDAEIRSMDRAFGRLLELVEQLGLDGTTAVIFTSDHGEEFGEHGWYGWHAHTLYDELLRVPLVIRLPGGDHAGQSVRRPVRSLDIAPTLLRLLDLPVPDQMEGIDLLDVVQGTQNGHLFAVSQEDLPADDRQVTSIRSRRWKLYDGRLFDLRADPGESYDIAASHWDIFRALQARLEQALEGRRAPEASPVELDPETRQRLEALGYL